MLHAILNTASLTSYLTSLIARRCGARGFGIAAAAAGYGLMSVAAFLGGELSFGMQLGVKHTAVPAEPPQDFVRVLDASALSDGVMHAAEVETIPLLVTRTGAAANAVSGVCTHRGAPLAEGTQAGNCVRCPWHGSRFALDDGRVVEGPASFGLACFEARITEGAVSVRAARL
jgi:nitrite reductase/ring-hydroxylating ferredoxin subunit